MSDSCGPLVSSFLHKYMYHMSSSEMERGWTAEVEPLWEDIAGDGKGDLVLSTDIFDAHASVFLVKNEQQQVVQKVSSYYRWREKTVCSRSDLTAVFSLSAARCTV